LTNRLGFGRGDFFLCPVHLSSCNRTPLATPASIPNARTTRAMEMDVSIEALRKTGKFSPSEELVKLAESTLLAKAHAELMTERVEKYQRQILADGSFKVEGSFPDAGKPITDPSRSYLMSEVEFARYLELCRIEQGKAELKTLDPEGCPALESQHLFIQAEYGLRKAFAEEVGEPSFASAYIAPELKQKLMGCIYGLLAPKMASASTIMQRLAA